jgi:hypothetical protein
VKPLDENTKAVIGALSSWLNQVGIWFAKIEREVIQWKYSDPTRRLHSNEFIATGHFLTERFSADGQGFSHRSSGASRRGTLTGSLPVRYCFPQNEGM